MEVDKTSSYVDLIVDLAQQVEIGDPIDWGMLTIDEQNAYRMVALSVLEHTLPKYNDPNFREIILATVVKLVVENFTLNLKMRENKDGR